MSYRYIRQWSLVALIIAASLGWVGKSALAQDQRVQVVASTSDGYCHLKIPAVRPSTYGNDKPELKSAQTGDMIDYYGSCDVDPTGKLIVSPQETLRGKKYGKF